MMLQLSLRSALDTLYLTLSLAITLLLNEIHMDTTCQKLFPHVFYLIKE